MFVLVIGLVATGVAGLLTGGFGLFGWLGAMGGGITGMGELIIITLLAGGMLELIRLGGGIDYVITRLTNRVRGKRGAELSIAALVSIANCCTANNTIAIITVGAHCARYCRPFRGRSAQKRQHSRYLFVFCAGADSLWRATAHCCGTDSAFAARDHAIPLLPGHDGLFSLCSRFCCATRGAIPDFFVDVYFGCYRGFT